MKICHLSSVHVPFDTRIFHKECVSLNKAGHEVCLVIRHGRDEVVDGIRIKAIDGTKNRLGRAIAVYRRAQEERHDVYHFHDPELIPFALLLKLKGKRVIYDAHEDYPIYFANKEAFPRILRKPLSLVISIIERLSAGVFDAVVTVTPKIHDRFKSINKKTVMVCNFPFAESESTRELPDKDSDPRSLAYVGSLTYDRCVREMIQATAIANENAKVRLLMGGDFGSESDETEVKAMPGFEHVDYFGRTSKERNDELFSRASIGLVLSYPKPNYMDAYPTKLFEYMAAGLPVIAADFPLWRGIVEDAGCGLTVDPMKPDKIAEAIQTILGNPDRMAEMGNNGRKAAAERYTWPHEEEILLGLYDKLLK